MTPTACVSIRKRRSLRVVRVALGDGYEVRVRLPVTLEPAPPALVIKVPEKVGRYSPPEKRIHIELPDGREYEPIDDTDAF